jgi:hypothetical protein
MQTGAKVFVQENYIHVLREFSNTPLLEPLRELEEMISLALEKKGTNYILKFTVLKGYDLD